MKTYRRVTHFVAKIRARSSINTLWLKNLQVIHSSFGKVLLGMIPLQILQTRQSGYI